MLFFGIAGHARSGKDTVAEYLCKELDLVRVAFADPVKCAAAEAFGVAPAKFFDPEAKELYDPYWGISPREMAQRVGTECFRREFGTDFWIRRADKDFRLHNYYCVVPDVRFQEEAEFIVEKGGFIIHLTRPGADGKVGVPNHASEAGIDFTNFEKGKEYAHIHNDVTLEQLYQLVDAAIEQYYNS
jgi:hypothetical protein